MQVAHIPKIIFVELRTDEDREINHHGRTVEIGETENPQANVIKVYSMLKDMAISRIAYPRNSYQ